MAYATIQDFIAAGREQELVDLTDLAGTGAPDAGIVGSALDKASAMIDNYLARRYRVPLTVVPDVVKGWALDIALYRLYREAPTEPVQVRYEDALRQLRDISTGRAVLAGVSESSETAAPEYSAPGRRFTARTLEDF